MFPNRILPRKFNPDCDAITLAGDQKVVETHVKVIGKAIAQQIKHTSTRGFIIIVSQLKAHESGRINVY
jgi:hypothetical protein